MSHKKEPIKSPKEFLPTYPHNSGNEHMWEHIYFLEERMTVLEAKVETLREVFARILELEDDQDDQADEEDEEGEEDFLSSKNYAALWGEDEA